MATDSERVVLIEAALHGIVLDPALRLVARLVDEARVAADGRTPTRTDELATVLSGGQLADHELSAGAARAGRIARHCAGGDQ